VPVVFHVPEPWKSRGWRLKIRDRERLESPHVTFIFKARSWRLGLREGVFLDREPDPDEVPVDLVVHVLKDLAPYYAAWDELYPHNPVVRTENDDAEND
jgi:hypothetical protein